MSEARQAYNNATRNERNTRTAAAAALATQIETLQRLQEVMADPRMENEQLRPSIESLQRQAGAALDHSTTLINAYNNAVATTRRYEEQTWEFRIS